MIGTRAMSATGGLSARKLGLFGALEARLRALVDHRQEPLDAVVPDHIRMRIARLASRQRRQLRLRAVEIGVIGDQYVGARLRDEPTESLRGFAVVFEPEL